MQTNTNKLLPCPFCGSPAEVLDGSCFPIGCRTPKCHGWIYRDHGWSNKEVTIEAWNTRSPKQEIQELSVTAVSELIQNTAREEEELIIPVELVLMLARAICRTFGRPATFGTPAEKGLDENMLIEAAQKFCRETYDMAGEKEEYHEKFGVLIFFIKDVIIPNFARPMVSREDIQKIIAHNRHLLRKDIRDNEDTHKSLATAIHHLLEGKKG